MNNTIYFHAHRLHHFCLGVDRFLAKEAEKFASPPDDVLFPSPLDYISLLKLFPQLRLKQDFEIQGCYFFDKKREFLFGELWAQHKKASRNSIASIDSYTIHWPDGAIGVSDALEELNQLEDCMAYSLFMRALVYTKGFSIHSQWFAESIIDVYEMNTSYDTEPDQKLVGLIQKILSSDHTYNFKPRVVKDGNQIKVIFYVYKPSYPASIIQYIDVYEGRKPVFTTERASLVSIPEGIIIN